MQAHVGAVAAPGDRRRTVPAAAEVLRNLLGNVQKTTPQGAVSAAAVHGSRPR